MEQESQQYKGHRLDFPNNHTLFLPHNFKDHKSFYDTIGINETEWLRWNKLIKVQQDTLEYNTALREAYQNIARGYWQMTRLTGKLTGEFMYSSMKAHDYFRILMHLSFEEPVFPCDNFLDRDWNTRTPVVL